MPQTNPYYTPRSPDRSFNAPGVDSLLGADSELSTAVEKMGKSTYTDPSTAARNAGYTVKGNEAVKYVKGQGGRGIPMTAPLNQFGGSHGPQMDPTLVSAFLHDQDAMQGAADQQWSRNNEAISGMGDYVNSLDDRLMGQGDALFNGFIDRANSLDALGNQQMSDYQGAARPINRDIDEATDAHARGVDRQIQGLDRANADLDAGYAKADEAAAYMEQVKKDYADTGAMEASAAASAISRSAKQEERAITSGLLPDGSKMTPQEQSQAIVELGFRVKSQVQEAITPMLVRYNEVGAQLGQAVAQLKLSAGQARIQGAETRKSIAQTGGQLEQMKLEGSLQGAGLKAQMADQLLKAQQGQRDMAQLSSALHQGGAQIVQAALLKTAEMEFAGLTKTAELIQQNPRSITSWLQGILGLYAAQVSMRAGSGGVATGGAQKPRVEGSQQQAQAQAPAPQQQAPAAPAREYSWDRVARERQAQARSNNMQRSMNRVNQNGPTVRSGGADEGGNPFGTRNA